ATVEGGEPIRMYQRWPVRRARPYKARHNPTIPLITGQRVIDTFFPIVKGGTGSIPGAFGTGKTVTLHQIAKWADSQVVVYIGCGERGNEMTEVLVEFPHLKDPRTGKPLMDRTVLVANTSNMPVAAREASIYTGVTIAEYYRDMGNDVVLVADSTSRWAEALREMSGRLEEMPAEEGYPSYLASRLAEFYERAGRVRALGGPDRDGSVTLVGAVSPSGGDFTEPVTTHTMRFIKTFWALDAKLAYSRHYPSINWMNSYSGYLADISTWWEREVSEGWHALRQEAYGILQREDTLKEIVRLLGTEALPDEEKLVLEIARMIKIGILQQNSFDEVDTYCDPKKQYMLLKIMMAFYDQSKRALQDGAGIADIRSLPVIASILKARMEIRDDEMPKLEAIMGSMEGEFAGIRGGAQK
ncbi:MAG: V-type ATP synthase subunit A, partial [Thaumarchaeota archaeon S13]